MHVISLYLIDALVILIIAGFLFNGLMHGLIKMIGSLIGLIAGIFIASHFYLQLFGYVQKVFFGYDRFGKVLMFLLIFVVVNRLFALLFDFIQKGVQVIAIVPFFNILDRLAGGIFGLLEGLIVLSLVIFLAFNYATILPFIGGFLDNLMLNSKLAPYFIQFAEMLKPFVPEIINRVKDAI